VDIPYSWLGQWLADLPEAERVAHDLTGLGYEVAAVEDIEAGLGPVVLAEVVRRTPHPQADHLWLVTVTIGDGREVTVVTGASNGLVGERVWYGPPHTVLPDGRHLTTVTLRGVESPGMLLSAPELGYVGPPEEDLWLYRGPAPTGSRWTEVMGRETVIRVELTPNLAQHAQSALGVARDLAAFYGRRPPALPSLSVPTMADPARVVVEDADACPVYALGEFQVTAGRMEPAWQRRLRAAGFRLISPVVDATNAVLMDVGQPLHAFDADRVRLPIVVRRARPGERLELLDGRTVTLSDDDLVIADQTGALALAGIMGGAATQVTPATRRILVESAHFDALTVYRTARRLELMTDAAQRFSRGTDPEAVAPALERFRLFVKDAGALVADGPAVLMGKRRERRRVPWQPDRLRAWLGVDWSAEDMAKILERLGFSWRDDAVEIPTYRPDVAGGQDLAEEIARVRGMNAIPARLPARRGLSRPDPVMAQNDRLRDLLVAAGYMEVLPRNLIPPTLPAELGVGDGVHRVVNPLREEESLLAPTVLPALLLTARYNRDRDVDHQGFFTVSPVFSGTPERPRQEWELGVYRTLGPHEDLHGGHEVTVYDLTGLVEWLMQRSGWELEWDQTELAPFLHPRRALRLTRRGRPVGWVGELHPAVTERWRLGPSGVMVLTVPPPPPAGSDRPVPTRPSRYPEVRRDLSVIVPESVPYRTIEQAIRQAGGPYLTACQPFDRFRGPFGESLSLRLRFQAEDRTLTESEVDQAVQSVLAALSKYGVNRRG
jgi:phenylalanyl-tRNA synthetase beta chain